MYTTVAPAQLARHASRNDHRLAIAQANFATLSQRQQRRRLAKRPAPGIRVAVGVFAVVALALLGLVVGTVTGHMAEAGGATGGLITLAGSLASCLINR